MVRPRATGIRGGPQEEALPGHPRTPGRGLLLPILLELLAWLAAPGAFLLLYVGHFGRPSSAIAPHIGVVVVAWYIWVLLRTIAGRLGWGRGARVALALATGSFLMVLLLYYALVAVGLQYWNQVVSWDLIVAYVEQRQALVAVLEVPLVVLALVGLLIYGTCCVGAWLYLQRYDWAREASARFRPKVLLLMATLVLVLAVGQAWAIRVGIWSSLHEPLGLTFSPHPFVFQNHALDGDLRLQNNLSDQKDRDNYEGVEETFGTNVILIVVDGLRPDHMGVLGYSRNTTPALSALARQRRVEHPRSAKSVCSESLCGLVGLAASSYLHRFSDRPFTLQEVLRLHGYRVHMLLSGDHTSFYGLRSLYGRVDTFLDGSGAGELANDDSLVLEAIQHLPDWDGQPVMLQIHLMSAHLLAPRPEGPFSPAFRYGLFARNAPGDGQVRSEQVVNFYDNGVVQTDRVIGSLLVRLEERGYLADAIVVVTSDHGEALGEHGIFGHARSVHGPSLWVPLLFYRFGGTGAPLVVDSTRMASLIDVAPTILRDLGIPAPARWLGEPLQESWQKRFILFQQGHQVGLIDRLLGGGPWKFWLDVRTGRRFAFNLGLDPAEECNVSGLVPRAVEGWEEELRRAGALQVSPFTRDGHVPASLGPGSCTGVSDQIQDVDWE